MKLEAWLAAAFPWLGWFLVAFSWLLVARAVVQLHMLDGYVAGLIFALGLCFTSATSSTEIDSGARASGAASSPT